MARGAGGRSGRSPLGEPPYLRLALARGQPDLGQQGHALDISGTDQGRFVPRRPGGGQPDVGPTRRGIHLAAQQAR